MCYGRVQSGLLVHGGLLEYFMEEKGLELVLGTWVGFGWLEKIVTSPHLSSTYCVQALG